MTIDMKSYMGEATPPAATEQQQVYNSYKASEQEYPLPLPPEAKEDLPPEPQAAPAEPVPAAPVEDAQSLNFKALQASVEQLKAEREAEKREYQLQLDMMRANLVQRPVQEPQRAPKMFDGMEDNDVPNVADIRRAWGERESAYSERLEELQFASQHPDYAEVLMKHGKKLSETDPLFVQGIRGAENKAAFAYQYAKKEQRLQELEQQMKVKEAAPPPQKSADAQRIVENARKPGTLAQAGGQSVLSKADYFETMSDADFMKYAAKHLESI